MHLLWVTLFAIPLHRYGLSEQQIKEAGEQLDQLIADKKDAAPQEAPQDPMSKW